MMSFMTGTPIDLVFQQIAEDLVLYSNAFLIKSRIDMTNIGGLQAKGIYDTKPVGGYFRVDPTTVQIKRDKTGVIKNYQQQVGNDKKAYKPTDVIHFYIDKKGGAAFGTPRIEAALEDVKMLRKIEGNVLRLIYRYAAPLYQMKIGIPEQGFMATDQEIKDARKEIERLADDGIIITNERTEFNAIGSQGQVLDASKYLSYFESRVFTALSLSYAQAGRGGAKQDADSMEEQVHDSIKFFQRTIAIFVEQLMFNELLLEGGYNPITEPTDIVRFQFNEINLDTRVKMETHAMNLFQGNAIPYEEMRGRLGLDTDDVDESRLYQNMIKTPAEIAILQAKLGQSSGSAQPGPEKSQDAPKTATNMIQPKNQHGTSSVKIKESSQNIQTKEDRIEDYQKAFKDIYKKFQQVRNDVLEDGSRAYASLPIARDWIASNLKNHTSLKAQEGYNQAIKDTKKKPDKFKVSSKQLSDMIDDCLDNMFKDIQSKYKEATTPQQKEAAFDKTEYRLRFLAEHVAAKAYWYGYIKTCEALNIDKVYVQFGKGSKDKEDHESILNPKSFSLEDIPAFHPYCKCTLSSTKSKKGG
jgi:portal protein|uniref:Portal protein n=1 Tax=Myoviridae sp. ctyhJ29 TaxID=2827719 RepID=A0A8S5SFB8_9CAUD|nr:MAG TPA: Portal protein [Myoviridae sp. ctyhJ29]